MAKIQIPDQPAETGPAVAGIPGVAILPLRLFLGVTFIYASYQKFMDPGFFHNGSLSYIGTQIVGFSHGTPLGGVLALAAQHAVAVGALTIITEFTIGCLTLTGLFTRGAALTGLFLNFTFFLSASWLVYPYFLGSDIVFVAAWLTIVFTGPGAYALDFRVGQALVRQQQRSEIPLGPVSRAVVVIIFGPPVTQELESIEQSDPPPSPDTQQTGSSFGGSGISRRQAGLGILAAGLLFLLGITPRKWTSRVAGAATPTSDVPSRTPLPTRSPVGNSTPTPVATSPPSPTTAGSASPTPTPTSSIPVGAQQVGNTSSLPVNSAVNFTDDVDGNPALVVHNTDGKFVAFSAVCTHQGCTVAYDSTQNLIVCPCHGSTFDANDNGAVTNGPAFAPLPSLPIKIDASGNIYIT